MTCKQERDEMGSAYHVTGNHGQREPFACDCLVAELSHLRRVNEAAEAFYAVCQKPDDRIWPLSPNGEEAADRLFATLGRATLSHETLLADQEELIDTKAELARLRAWVAEQPCEDYGYVETTLGEDCGTCPPCQARKGERPSNRTCVYCLSQGQGAGPCTNCGKEIEKK